jgi:hypothetical protein
MAVGLGSMDMPVPSVAEWAWLNWKFPRAVHAGDTIYARWTLTQKRAPVGNAPTAIVVWRVDVHTTGGALCAEGEVGASVIRNAAATRARVEAASPKAPVEEPSSSAAPAARRRGRRRRPAGEGAKAPVETTVALVVEAPVVAPAQGTRSPAAGATAERTAGGARRRRRRRSPASAQARNGVASAPAAAAEAPAPATSVPKSLAPEVANPLTRAIRRLRRS